MKLESDLFHLTADLSLLVKTFQVLETEIFAHSVLSKHH